MIEYYLDWRPSPTHAIDPRAFHQKQKITLEDGQGGFAEAATKFGLPVDMLAEHFEYATFAFRTDGLFVFSISWKTAAPKKIQISCVCLVSHFIKEVLGHVHIFNRSRKSVIQDGKDWRPFYKYPVKLDSAQVEGLLTSLSKEFDERPSVAAILEKILTDDSTLASLSADYFPSEQHVESEEPRKILALLRLRSKYSQLYTKSDQWISAVKNQTLGGFYLYQGPMKYFLSFCVIVAAWTVHDAQEVALNGQKSFEVFLAGLVASLSVLAFWLILSKLLAVLHKWVASRIAGFTGPLFKREAKFFFKQRGRIFPPIPLVIFLFLVPGPFVFSIEEAPSALDLFKIAKIDYMEPAFAWFENRLSLVSLTKIDANRNFAVELVKNALTYAPFLVVLFYILDVVAKRKRVISCLGKLRAHLYHANILNASLDSVFYRSTDTGLRYKYYGFDDAIAIVTLKLEVETQKRNKSLVLCGIVLLTSGIFSAALYFDKWVPWLQQVTS